MDAKEGQCITYKLTALEDTRFPFLCVSAKSLSHVRLFVTLWTVSRHTLLFVRFSRHEYWSGLPCPPPGDLSDPGVEPISVASLALAGGFFLSLCHLGNPEKH